MGTPTGGGTWTPGGVGDNGVNQMHLKLWTRPVDISGTQTVTCNNTHADAFHMPVLYVIKGISVGVQLSVDGAAASQGLATASHVCPSVTPAGADDLLLCGAGESPVGSGGYTWPGGMTEETDVNAGAVSQASTASQLLTAAGPTGTRTATFIAARNYVSGTVAVRATSFACQDFAATAIADPWAGATTVDTYSAAAAICGR
jgi:hypothetical protein